MLNPMEVIHLTLVYPYISNGAFIAAAYFLGFTVKRINDGPNAYINISSKTVTPLRAAVGYD